jgi:putative Mg2+ transporter-C (MgtC) family protein
MDIDLHYLARMAAAVFCGALIGLNRDIHGKPTGIRAHALVSLGAALLVIAGVGRALGGAHPDALSRVIQGIVAGIGFLGAGVILRGATGKQVYHLVTAASLWVTTGVGILCGLGEFVIAGAATACVLLILVVGLPLDRWLYGRSGVHEDDRQ